MTPQEDLDRPATLRDLRTLEAAVDKRFEQVDKRFEQIDKRFEQVDRRFEQVGRQFEQLNERFAEVRRHFDVVAEQMKSEFKMWFDVTKVATDSLGERLDAIEKDHGARLMKVETRLLAVESGGRKKKPTRSA